ncbi:acylphosphatase [Candidatus Pacearchaeota archaeon]|nr:acylphosphatase [Candidatus Pacearchaeota archaeon]|tara:strand:+ start:522 stop:800 length:279 start_codon:yes stop_codon:yes gene_type:complete
MKKAAKIVVSGTVQGVFFRGFIKKKAEGLGLTGFVRNLEDGNVEVVVEGERENINKLVDFCKKGPEHSIISGLKTEEIKWSGDFKEFKILRF